MLISQSVTAANFSLTSDLAFSDILITWFFILFFFFNLHFHAASRELPLQYINNVKASCLGVEGWVDVFHNKITLLLTWLGNISDLDFGILHIIFYFSLFLNKKQTYFCPHPLPPKFFKHYKAFLRFTQQVPDPLKNSTLKDRSPLQSAIFDCTC